ncbi:MAG: UDP-N-acetylmuramate dehydrogenase [Oscillospiraceae bacterium]|nr:UDP-N-acetylmuramate dehydrogenase [Oscillospiraceae bacterium]
MERFEQLAAALRQSCPALELREHEPMARHTTFRIGGPVRLMALPRSEGEVLACLREAERAQVRLVVLGNGSNLLAADGEIPCFAVLLTGLDALERTGEREIWAGAGVSLARLASFAAQEGLAGLEFAHGIPGTLGGGVLMNAGAYGGEMVQVVKEVAAAGRNGGVETVPAEQCGFSYRRSAFSDGERVILGAKFQLEPDDPAAIRSRMDDLARRRKEKQPLEYPSAGSMFKRPAGHFAAALIEQCGLKGLTVGGAQVSEKHAGFVINRGGATCADVLALVDQVKERVLQQTGVELEMEVRVLR